MTERELEIKLLKEVMQWLGLQIGIPDLGDKNNYTEIDFLHLEKFLESELPNDTKRRREKIYGYISARNILRFWKSEDEKGGKTRKVLSAIAMLNRDPFISIPIKEDGSRSEPLIDLSENYKKIKEKEEYLANNEVVIGEESKLKEYIIKLFKVIGILLFFILAWNFFKTKLEMTPMGEPVADWNVYFRMRDENSLWKSPKFTFYKPILGEENTFIVKAIGLYRKKGTDTYDSTFNHSGKAFKVGEFLHITLTPDDPKQYNTFGNWEAQVYVGGNNFEIGKSEPCFGLGGGISGYQDEVTTKKQGKFVVYCKQAKETPKPDSVIFQEMYQYIKKDTFKMKLDRLNTDKSNKELIIRQGIRMNH